MATTKIDCTVDFEGRRQEWKPGEVFAAKLTLMAPFELDLKGAEVSVLWRTEGKGDVDLGVIWREDVGFLRGGASCTKEIRVTLPREPVTYLGTLLRIHWQVRLRAMDLSGVESVIDKPFIVRSA